MTFIASDTLQDKVCANLYARVLTFTVPCLSF